jgi:glyoxylase-like metal-dependent hydrolase (beta-lactamase superfamily II)
MINQIAPKIYQLYFKEFGSCVYVLDLKKLILIDTSSKEVQEELLLDLKSLNIEKEEIESIILTHSHWDHIGNIDLFPNAQVYFKNNTDELKKDFPEFKIIETPGHTRDSICILYKDILFSGDTIFDKYHTYVGRTDLPESNEEQMQKSLENLKNLKYEILCPGHLI